MKKLIVFFIGLSLVFSCAENSSAEVGGVQIGNGTGTGGSLARFTVIKNHLYAVDGNKLKVFNINDKTNPVFISDHSINALVETVFPFQDSILFIGTNNGMLIYDVSLAPAIKLLSTYRHIVACDPVVANATTAYITLRSDINNNFCNRGVNQLDIIDITNLSDPTVITEFPLIKPYGLGLYGDTLLVCDNGIKVFDISEPASPLFITADENLVNARDIIPLGDLMIIMATDGIFQYRYTKGKLTLLSQL
jgi:hypothetical protein